MASQAKVMEQKQEIEALKRELAQARALTQNPPMQPCTSAQAKASTQPCNDSFKMAGNTPSRKRNATQQLGSKPKDCRVVGAKNRFDVLTQAESYPDKSMRPGSICSNKASYAKVVGKCERSRGLEQSKAPPTSTPLTTADEGYQIEDDNMEVEGIFCINNDRAFREEIEVQFLTLNGLKFCGSITYQEAKHVVFKECLGFGDFTNFDGARVGFKGVPVVTFKLKTAINVDELINVQRFIFARKSTRQGEPHTDEIHCMITGLRQQRSDHVQTGQNTFSKQPQDDGTRKIQIQGCEYRIPKEVLVEYLSNFGELASDIKEALFEDGGDPHEAVDGTNRTGNYNVRIKLRGDIPQLLPILGKRIRVYYPGIQRQCTNCFKGHPKNKCHSKKMSWNEYTLKFMNDHPEINQGIIQRQQQARNHKQPSMSTTESVDEVMVDETAAEIDVDLDESTSTSYTNEWVDKHGSISQVKPTQVTNPTSHTTKNPTTKSSSTEQCTTTRSNGPPNKKDFNVPANRIEHNLMVAKLVSSGILETEAEQIITLRKNAFNKACRDLKKQGNTALKKPNKSRKTASPKTTHNGN